MDTETNNPIHGEWGHLFTEDQVDQTVPNAEHQAVYQRLIAIVHTPRVVHADIHTDCQLVYDGFTKGQEWTAVHEKATIWEEMWG